MTWLDVPNKPMVRIATTALAEPARDPGRPYIGQPLGGQEWRADRCRTPCFNDVDSMPTSGQSPRQQQEERRAQWL